MDSYSQAALERAMKPEMILRAMAKKITWWQAAKIIGISDRSMRRWHERYEEHGYDGLLDRRRGQPSPKRVPLATVEQVLGLYRDRYFDLNVQHFHEKLGAQHGIHLSYSWVKQALQGAGLVARGRKRGVHRKRRERRPLPGMLRHIDGSRHRWFQDERWYDLIVILDDASSEIYYAQLVEEESPRCEATWTPASPSSPPAIVPPPCWRMPGWCASGWRSGPRLCWTLTCSSRPPARASSASPCARMMRSCAPMLASVDDAAARTAANAERAVVAALDGSCRTPIGAYARMHQGSLQLTGLIGRADGSFLLKRELHGAASNAERIGRELGASLRADAPGDVFA